MGDENGIYREEEHRGENEGEEGKEKEEEKRRASEEREEGEEEKNLIKSEEYKEYRQTINDSYF